MKLINKHKMQMKSLYDTLVDLYQSGVWNYYSKGSGHNESCPFPLSDEKEAKEFIQRYFESGEKKSVTTKDILNFSPIRNLHSVATFLMGGVFKEFVPEEDFNSFAEKECVEFFHAWFIISLYHDFGYKYEKGSKYCCFGGYINCLKLKYNLLFNSKYEFNKEMVYNYLNYRRKFDHGITAGLLLFDRLKKNYNAMSEKYNKRNLPEFKIPNTNIKFSEKDEDHYFLYAKCIIEHNMWYAYKKNTTLKNEWKSTRRKYKDSGLESLIIENKSDRINYKNNPLFFILCLVDSLELIKIDESVNLKSAEIKAILQKINLEVSENLISIEFADQNPDFKETYMKKIDDLKYWMSVKISLDSNSVKIEYDEC